LVEVEVEVEAEVKAEVFSFLTSSLDSVHKCLICSVKDGHTKKEKDNRKNSTINNLFN